MFKQDCNSDKMKSDGLCKNRLVAKSQANLHCKKTNQFVGAHVIWNTGECETIWCQKIYDFNEIIEVTNEA